jgi:nicotinamidase-related amidase
VTQITLNAKPGPISMDPAKTAVIVVDMQNDFGSTGGMFDRAGIDISGIQAVVAPTARVLAAARRGGMTIVYLKMGYRPDLSDLGATDRTGCGACCSAWGRRSRRRTARLGAC